MADLVFRAKEVAVVLREATDAGHAVEFTGLLPAVDRTELGKANWKVAVGMRLRGENTDVVGAVHRLQQEALNGTVFEPVGQLTATAAFLREKLHRLALDERRELGVLIIGEVAGGPVEVKVADVRREDLLVARLEELGRDEVLELLAHDGTVRGPENQALANFLIDMEKL